MYDNNSFFYKMKQTVYKWWCVIYKPVYKLTHHGYWPKEKEPYYQPESANTQNSDSQSKSVEEMANRIVNEKQSNIDELVNHTSELVTPDASVPQSTDVSQNNAIDTSNVDADVMSRANEIMDRLAKEAAEDEAKKQAERDKARQEADEQQRLAAILRSTKVDISPFIEEGKAMQHKSGE